MSERYCPYCGAHNLAVADTCASCRRYLPGTEGHRHETSGKRKTATWAIVLGLVIAVFGYLLEGGPQIINTRRGPATEGSFRLQLILVGAGLAGYGAFSLYRLREER
jgi:hypothetical protein